MKVLAREKTGDVLLSEAFNPSSEGRQHHFQPSVLLLPSPPSFLHFSSTSHTKAFALSIHRAGLDVPRPI